MFVPLPPIAGYVHDGVRSGFEVAFFRTPASGAGTEVEIIGGTSAIEDHRPWTVRYEIAVDEAWRTTRAMSRGTSLAGDHELTVEVRGGRWWINDEERPDLDGCVDIDFEASLVTNTLAVHRIDLTSQDPVEVPAAFVRADDLAVIRLEQSYRCVHTTEDRMVVAYSSTTFDFTCDLVFDRSGLVVDYPGLGRRHA